MKYLSLALLALAVIFFQAHIPLWRGHLEVDVWNYFLRVEHFFKYRTFFDAPGIEILPATSLFLLLPAFIAGLAPFLYVNYLNAFFIIILAILGLQLYLTRRRPLIQRLTLPFALVFLGPIILFRFEALAALLVAASLVLFVQKKPPLSAFVLGLATAVKVYPVIILPYLMLLTYSKKNPKAAIAFLLYYLQAILLSLIPYLYLGGRLDDIGAGLSFHALKYVSIESVPGSLLTGWSLLTAGRPLPLLGGYGVWGVDSPLVDAVGLAWFNRFWFLPVILFYWYLYRRPKLRQKLNFALVFCLILVFLLFSKNLHAQYLWWFVSLFPFFRLTGSQAKNDYFVLFGLTLVALLLNQNVYPVLYTPFLEDFYSAGRSLPIYYLMLLRNLTLITLLILSLRAVFVRKSLS